MSGNVITIGLCDGTLRVLQYSTYGAVVSARILTVMSSVFCLFRSDVGKRETRQRFRRGPKQRCISRHRQLELFLQHDGHDQSSPTPPGDHKHGILRPGDVPRWHVCRQRWRP